MAALEAWQLNNSMKALVHVVRRFGVHIVKDAGIGYALNLENYTIEGIKTDYGPSVQAQAMAILKTGLEMMSSVNSFWFNLQCGFYDIEHEVEYLHWMRENHFEDFVRHITH
jgi:hypothetical protein